MCVFDALDAFDIVLPPAPHTASSSSGPLSKLSRKWNIGTKERLRPEELLSS